MNTGHHRTGNHLHDRAAGFSAGFSRNGDVSTAAANAVVHPIASGNLEENSLIRIELRDQVFKTLETFSPAALQLVYRRNRFRIRSMTDLH